MKQRPRAISVIGWIFVAIGVGGILGDLWTRVAGVGPDVVEPARPQLFDLGLATVSRLLAVIGGASLLRGLPWARWLLVGWMAFHVVLGVLHSEIELVVHCVLFAPILYFLFRRPSSAYLRGAGAASPQEHEIATLDRTESEIEARVGERTFRHVLFVALLLVAPAVLFLVQVVFIVPPILLLAGAVRMVPKLITSGFGKENQTFFFLFLAGAVVLAAPYYLVAWLLGKVARRLPAGWPRPALLGVLLVGLAGVTQLPIYGGGGHGPGKFGPLQGVLTALDQSYGPGASVTVYLVALALIVLPLAIARWRKRRVARASPGSG